MSPRPPDASEPTAAGAPPRPSATRRRLLGVLVVVAVIAGFLGWRRVGILDLPSVPDDISFADSGLQGLEEAARIDAFLRSPDGSVGLQALQLDPALSAAVEQVHRGLGWVRHGDAANGLGEIQRGMRRAPDNLVLGNAYRMCVFQLQREFLRQASVASQLTPAFPEHLRDEPIAFLQTLQEETGRREVQLQLALAWVDQMLLFPALEIKAPASVQSVDILTGILQESPGYVPALFARGLNHLHRPARLVWPESEATPPDAAAQDIGQCIAIGRRFDAGSARLRARLALTLGDAYVKAGRLGVARSWWQIAQNISRDDDIQAAIRERYGWRDDEALDRLEEDLDRARLSLEVPMTDLAFVWR